MIEINKVTRYIDSYFVYSGDNVFIRWDKDSWYKVSEGRSTLLNTEYTNQAEKSFKEYFK